MDVYGNSELPPAFIKPASQSTACTIKEHPDHEWRMLPKGSTSQDFMFWKCDACDKRWPRSDLRGARLAAAEELIQLERVEDFEGRREGTANPRPEVIKGGRWNDA
jgi:hypothetical protein